MVVIEEDEDGGYVGSVPNLPGCHSQGDTLDELMKNMKEAIELYLEALEMEKEPIVMETFRGTQVIEVPLPSWDEITFDFRERDVQTCF